MPMPDLLIVGAGAAGLMASRRGLREGRPRGAFGAQPQGAGTEDSDHRQGALQT